jgi:hypothetical protein
MDPAGNPIVATLQYETIGMLGSNLGIGTLDEVARLFLSPRALFFPCRAVRDSGSKEICGGGQRPPPQLFFPGRKIEFSRRICSHRYFIYASFSPVTATLRMK